MYRCLHLAVSGKGRVAPNPMVAAVLVHHGRIIGEGYHRQNSGDHAEVNCINSVSEADKSIVGESTLYVSLEPCAHFGKTPPCADLIIKHKIPRVIIGCKDIFAAVNGKGIEKLQAAGLQVVVGVLEKECVGLNKRFFTFHEKHRPYIILKWASSKDGKMAGPSSSRLRISNEITDRLVHKWRHEEAAVLVGTNTALLDDPELTTRFWRGNNPVRLVIDKALTLPLHLKLFDGSVKTIVFNYKQQEGSGNLIYHQINKDENMVLQILQALYRLQIQSVIVEGGANLLQSFIDAGMWDEARIITNSTLVVGEGLKVPVLIDHQLIKDQSMGNDMISFYKRGQPKN